MTARDTTKAYLGGIARGQQQPEVGIQLSQSLVSLRQAGLNAVALIHNNGLPFNGLQLANVASQGVIREQDYVWLDHLHEQSNRSCAVASNM